MTSQIEHGEGSCIYRLEAGRYGRPTLLDLKGRTPLTAVSGVTVEWDRLLRKLR